jgi:hypothetical protein
MDPSPFLEWYITSVVVRVGGLLDTETPGPSESQKGRGSASFITPRVNMMYYVYIVEKISLL